MKTYQITPIPKPRMTQKDRWANSGYHVTFVLPMPDSWSKKKRAEMAGKPHQQKPDKDNLEKALLDAIFEDDCRIWDGRVTKILGEVGQIIIGRIE